MKSMLMAMVVAATSAATVLAHPGHGVTDPETPAHYVLEPVHAIPVLLLVAACVMVGIRRRAANRR